MLVYYYYYCGGGGTRLTALIRFCRRVRKIAKSYYLLRHVCPSARPSPWKNSAPIERIFMKFDTCVFRKSVEKIEVFFLNLENSGYFT
jgi:hypothetical protein